MAKKQAEPKIYTYLEFHNEGARSYERGYKHGEQHAWDTLAEYRDGVLGAVFITGIILCVAYTLCSFAFWLIP